MKNLPILFNIPKQGERSKPAVREQAGLDSLTVVVLLLLMLLGGFLRYQYLQRGDFPLNDGGLFYTMTRDLIANGWRIPAHTSYNHADIPFGYPPLGFYLAGSLNVYLGFNLLQVFRFLPFVFNVLTIPAFFFLAHELLRNQAQAVFAAFAFSFVAPAYEWLIMGGGITRAPGYFFAILTLLAAVKAMRSGRITHIATSVVCGALTAWFHLEMIWLVAISILFFGLLFARNRRGLILGATLGIGVGLLTAPYWLAVIGQNGIAPFLAANHSNQVNVLFSVFALFSTNWASEPFLTLFGVLALLGALLSIVRKDWLLVGWLFVLIVLDTRSINRSSVLPITMLAGVAIQKLVFPAISRACGQDAPMDSSGDLRGALEHAPQRFAILFLLIWTFTSSMLASYLVNPPLLVLSPAQREAMAWVKTNTPASSRFFVLPGSTDWFADRVSEWFPALADRTSLTTVQGHEWLPNGSFKDSEMAFQQIFGCTPPDLACVEKLHIFKGDPDYVYVTKKADSPAETFFNGDFADHSLKNNPQFKEVYENSEVMIYRHLSMQ